MMRWIGGNVPLADVVPQSVATSAPRVLTDNASDTIRGIALVVLANLIWTLGDATAKWVLPSVGVAGAMMWRGLFGMATVAAVTMGRPTVTGWRRLMPERWGLVLARSALSSLDETASPRTRVARSSGSASVSFWRAGKVARRNFNERRPPCRHYVRG